MGFINPKIKNYLNEQIRKNVGIIFIEWALLLEDNLHDIVDSIIMVNCQEKIQIKRLENGDLGKEQVIKRIKMQLTNEQKIEKLKQLKILIIRIIRVILLIQKKMNMKNF